MNKSSMVGITISLMILLHFVLSKIDQHHFERERQTDREHATYDRFVRARHNRISENLYTLEELRKGDTNQAVNYLEQQLTSDLIGFWYYYRQNPTAPHDSYVAEIISKIHEYRINHPDWRSSGRQVEWEGKTLDEKQVLAEVLTWTNAPFAK